jgi:hypothetical protein
MEYQVPQFIDVEDKIIGPLSFKQAIYIAGGIGMVVALILYLPLFLGILLSIPVAGLAGSLAFYKMNGKPFIEILESGFVFLVSGRLYLLRKEKHTVGEMAVTQAKEAAIAQGVAAADSELKRNKLTLSGGKLHDLALSLDIKTGEGTQEP